MTHVPSSQCVLGCSSKSRSKSVHRFPNPKKYPSQYAAWMAVLPEYCKDIDYNHRHYRICDKHFLEKDKFNYKRINRIAIPVLCLPGRPDTHNNCNCDGEMLDLHKDTESKSNKDVHSINITYIKHMSLLEREHDYAKPLTEAKTLKYANDSKRDASSCAPVITKCDELQNTKDLKVDFEKFEENYFVKQTIKETINDVSNQPQPALNGADVTRVTKDTHATLSTSSVKIKENIIPHHHNTNIKETSPKTKVASSRFKPTYKTYAVKEAIFSEKNSEDNKSTSTIPNTCFTNTNSEKLCVSKNTSSNSTNQQLPCFKDADSRLAEMSRNEKTKADTKLTYKLTCKSPYKIPATPINCDKVESKIYVLPKLKCNDLFHKLVTDFYHYKKDNLQTSKKARYDAYLLGSCIYMNSKLRFTNKKFPDSNDNLLAKEDVCKQVISKTTTKSNISTSETILEEICMSDYDTSCDTIDQQHVLSSNVEMVDKNIEKRSDNRVTVRICEESDTETPLECTKRANKPILCSDVEKVDKNIETNSDNHVTVRIYEESDTDTPLQSPKHANQPILCSDVEKVDKNIETNSDNHVTVRIYEESDTDTPLQSPKHANQPILCSDVENLDKHIETNSDNHVTVRIYEESDTDTPLQSPKRAKLHINELDQYRIVGSTTVFTGSLVQNHVLKDPLGVSPDIGIDCGGLIADIIKSEDEMSCVEGSIYSLEDNMETVNDMSIFEENSHLDDNIYPNYIDILKRFDNDDIDLKVEIAYALKFMHKKGISPVEAAKEILYMYGPDKMTVMEVESWYQEFDLGNKVTSIIYLGSPVYE